MDRVTIDFYETRSVEYERGREPKHLGPAEAFGARRPPGVAVDLGSGPGWYTAALGAPAVALDGAFAMVRRTREVAPTALTVQADLMALPFRRGALVAGWARNTYVHLRSVDVPAALGDLHRSLAVGAPVELTLFRGVEEGRDVFPDDDFPGRWFSTWTEERLLDVLHGAGLVLDDLEVRTAASGEQGFRVRSDARAHAPGPGRGRDALARERLEPERTRRGRRHRVRHPGQPVLACGDGGGPRDARSRPPARAPRAWRRHDRPRRSAPRRGRRVSPATSTAPVWSAWIGCARGCSRTRCASWDWPVGGPPSTAERRLDGRTAVSGGDPST